MSQAAKDLLYPGLDVLYSFFLVLVLMGTMCVTLESKSQSNQLSELLSEKGKSVPLRFATHCYLTVAPKTNIEKPASQHSQKYLKNTETENLV